jgi:hypothetical protein
MKGLCNPSTIGYERHVVAIEFRSEMDIKNPGDLRVYYAKSNARNPSEVLLPIINRATVQEILQFITQNQQFITNRFLTA